MSLKRVLTILLSLLLATLMVTACTEEGNQSQTESTGAESSEESKEETVKMPEYWGFNDYKRVNIVGAPEEITSFPTTVTKVSDRLLIKFTVGPMVAFI